MAKAGRKSKYEEKIKPYLKEINEAIRKGNTEEAIAKSLGISKATFSNYKLQHEELRQALKTNKGVEQLEALVNAGIESAKGYYKENETTTIILDENGQPTKRQKVVNKIWYPPNPTLNKFYVMNFGKEQGWTDNPMDYDLKKAKQDLDEALVKSKNFEIDFENK